MKDTDEYKFVPPEAGMSDKEMFESIALSVDLAKGRDETVFQKFIPVKQNDERVPSLEGIRFPRPEEWSDFEALDCAGRKMTEAVQEFRVACASSSIDIVEIIRKLTRQQKEFMRYVDKCLSGNERPVLHLPYNHGKQAFYQALKDRMNIETDPQEAKKEADRQRNKAEVKRRRREQFKRDR